MRVRPPRIALYSHDTMGLGHMRRNLLLAEGLVASPLQPSVLLIAGSREISRFSIPPRVDVLSLPALYKDSRSNYYPRSLDMSLRDMIALRSTAIMSALDAFQPDLFIVDNVPRGAVGELDPSLTRLRRLGRTRVVLGLRDVLDESGHVRREWARAANVDALRRSYDAIWVYGDREVLDVADAYGFPPDVADMVRYLGYLDQRHRGMPEDLRPVPSAPRMVLCLLGGGQDGVALAEAFAAARFPDGVTPVLVTGPMMSDASRARVAAAGRDNRALQVHVFAEEPARWMQAAECVITMGGYNTVCEILSHGIRALIVPRVQPRLEQLVRAELLAARGLVDCLHPDALHPAVLVEWAGRSEVTREVRPVELHSPWGLHAALVDVLERAPSRPRAPLSPLPVARHAS